MIATQVLKVKDHDKILRDLNKACVINIVLLDH